MTVDSPGFTSELDAVNAMLAAIGEAPVSTLEESGTTDVSLARDVLTETSREVQSRGWHFNEEDHYPLNVNTEGEIRLPDNALRIDLDERLYPKWDIIQRGKRLYSKSRHSYRFTESLRATICFCLPWDELPEAARYYIAVRAARVFADRTMGEPNMRRALQEDELRALISLKQYDEENADRNMLSHSSVSRVMGTARRFIG